MTSIIGVGIVGLSPQAGWAATAHVPALRSMPERFVIRGVANSTPASSAAAAASVGARAFDSPAALCANPNIDLVVVTVKVPHHAEIVRTALTADKAVLCEWPLARDYAEAADLAELARSSGRLAVVGTQAIYAPAVQRLQQAVDSGQLGEILSVRLTAYGMTWGRTIEARNAYLLDRANGATMLSIAVGHALSALTSVLGPVASVQSRLAVRRNTVRIEETGEDRAMTASDHVMVGAVTRAGVPITIDYLGGTPRGPGLHLQVDGTEGSARITGPSGLIELSPLTLEVSDAARRWELVQAPVEDAVWHGVASLYRYVAKVFAGGHAGNLPTFEDALKLHEVLQAIEDADASGCRVNLPV